MIQHLHIENYALIELLDLDLQSGFSTITGETGAGKSIIIGAISLLLGQRADISAIKKDAKRCVIEATFDVKSQHLDAFFQENDLDFDGTECIIRRELTSAGKSRAFINDSPASLAQLKELGQQLLDVHSQHKNLLLGKEDFQLGIIDMIASNANLLTDYQKEYQAYKKSVRQLEESRQEAQQNREDEEFIRFQAEQLADADLEEVDQEELEQESETLEHAEEIKTSLYQAANALQSPDEGTDALQLIKHCLSSLRSIASVYPAAEEWSERLDSCYIDLKDMASEMENQAEDVEYNPRRLEQINDRLNTIYSLQKKHHVDSVQELLEIQHTLEERLMHIDNSDEWLNQLEKDMEAQREKALAVAQKLSKSRQSSAKKVEKEMIERLLPLGMANVQFKCRIVTHTSELTPTGIDQVQFLFNANKSGELQPVSQIASGGEMSRVMLALKAMVAGTIHLPTIIFDEIDTGVSGSVAEKMARIMQEMGNNGCQVISITHLPQIASLADHHFRVYKEDSTDATLSHIIPLSQEERVEEIAHMLSGEELTQAALDNAKALLKTQ